ncbi:Putative phospholipid/glycerol acyltransferase [Septoria linicola]|uniref:Phospholipid/glycerol acyltransferase n=1 Tax=Septoria linicola TaxID=215465 RepID=A0A9Q9AQ07_9PEZI|nr:putative phospholipid/glycerol acyltransferase [Septoria linicola]USW52359.1 Putative phospholipid/glycerol acyltransferase [Septoria linicola]
MPASETSSQRAKDKAKDATNGIVYDIFLWIFNVVVELFFREIHPRSSWRIPKAGPVIFVAAPHANQFVDPLLLMRVVRHDAHRRIAFLVAEKSMRRKFIGFMAGLVGSVPVGRALDMKKPAEGKIYLPDPEGDPCLIRGTGTDFTSGQFMKSGLLVLPSVQNEAANSEIEEVISATEIRLKKPFKGDVALKQLTGQPLNGSEKSDSSDAKFEGIKFSVAPHVDQSHVYNDVFSHLHRGGCIGIFPEGGSHDRTELLPLKPGLAIMALGALEKDPSCNVKIVPVGMNYFNAHKFRSRAVIEFGAPIEIEPELVEQYSNGRKRDAVGTLLDRVHDALSAVTVQAPDYETLMLVQAVRRLYNPKGRPLPLPTVVELNRRLVKGYQKFKDDPKIIKMKEDILAYNRALFRLNIRDHQVSYAKFPIWKVVLLLIYRSLKVIILGLSALPGVILFSPVFILAKLISIKKAREALAASSVKVKARDVVATWKILVSLALTPALDIFYTVFASVWTYKNHIRGWVPAWVPVWLVAISSLIFFPAICFAALRVGEIGMDILKSLRPLLLSVNPTSSNTLVRLRRDREVLSERINEVINELGPQLYPDFDHNRILSDPTHPLHSPERSRPGTPSHRRDHSGELDALQFTPASPTQHKGSSSKASNLPRNESFQNLGSIGMFASRPTTPNRSRSRANSGSGGFSFGSGKGLGFTSIDSNPKANLEEVSKNLHEAMRERGRRRRESESDGWVIEREDESDDLGSELGETELEPKKLV